MIKLSDKLKRGIIMYLIVGYLFMLFALYQLPDGLFHIYFLDIGQGDSILIESPEGHHILVDGGPGSGVLEELAVLLPFFSKDIDLMVLTHPHADHIDGLVEVLKRYEVKSVLFSAVDFSSGAYDEFLHEINEQEIDFWVAEKDEDFRFNSMILDVVYPLNQISGEQFENFNNSSLALRIIYDDVKILLSGDLELEAEKELISSGVDIRADILKAGHHGSKTSSSLSFLRKIQAKVVVIQVGKNNKFGHPHEESLRRFEKAGIQKIYRNDLDGRIEFVF